MVAMSCFTYLGYNPFSHFMIDVLNLKLRFTTDVLRVQVHYSSLAPFLHSDLNLLMECLYLLVRKGLFHVSVINRFSFSI